MVVASATHRSQCPSLSSLTQLCMKTEGLRLTTMGFVLAPGPDYRTLAMLIYVVPSNWALRLGGICNQTLRRPYDSCHVERSSACVSKDSQP